jgi:hypothetical protein
VGSTLVAILTNPNTKNKLYLTPNLLIEQMIERGGIAVFVSLLAENGT